MLDLEVLERPLRDLPPAGVGEEDKDGTPANVYVRAGNVKKQTNKQKNKCT